jgi:flagellar P-ring protein FlgI
MHMRDRNRTALLLFALLLGALGLPGRASAERFQDLADLVGARSNQLVGYGLVVGLNGSGDGAKAEFTVQSVVAMLQRLGILVDAKKIKIKNVAAVVVTSEIPAFARPGQKLEVLVSSLGDAKSLRGGTLIQTPLRGADRQVYAVAQGPISVGGFSAKGGAGGAQKTSNHPTVGRIPGGAFVEKEIATTYAKESAIRYALRRPSSRTASKAAAAINEALGGPYAFAEDPGLVSVKIPEEYAARAVDLLASIGDIQVETEGLAKIVINERTGTVVVGSEVRLRPAAIAHGGLTVEIKEETVVHQPTTPLTAGQTVVTKETTVDAETAPGDVYAVPSTTTVGDLVNALNTLGVKPADLIIIFQSLAQAGAVSAEIEVQ